MKKKLLTFALLLLLITQTKAQQYYPLLDSVNIWSYSYTLLGVRLEAPPNICSYPSESFKYVTYKDTSIHSFSYKQLYATAAPYVGDSCLFGFLREDTSSRKVYFQDVLDSPEIVLYDFSMQRGDSIQISFIDSGGYFANGIYILDSINTINIKAGVRRVFYLNCSCANSNTLIWIESVGNLGDAIYPYAVNYQTPRQLPSCSSLTSEFDHITTCFEHNQLVYYDSCALHVASTQTGYWYGDTCDYGNFVGAVHEVSSLAHCKLSPNPVTNQLTIQASSFHSNEPVSISIVNVLGEIIYIEQYNGTQGAINCKSFPAGIYFVQLTTAQDRWVGRFVKE